MGKKQTIPTYVAHIQAVESGYRTVIARDGEQVYEGVVRRKRKTARLDAARFVVECPEKQRNLQWDDPYVDDPAEDDETEEEETPGVDLERMRKWVDENPRIKKEERRVILSAINSFEQLQQARNLSPAQLTPIVAAARCRLQGAWDIGGRLLAALAVTQSAAQDAFRELVASPKANERLQAVLSLSARMPTALLEELLRKTVDDQSKRVRLWTAEHSNSLLLRQMVPRLLERAKVEREPDVKRSLEFNAALIQDGYFVEPEANGQFCLYIRLREGGLTAEDITQKDIDRGRVPAIVAKRQSERY
jgi:hypothetical protein